MEAGSVGISAAARQDCSRAGGNALGELVGLGGSGKKIFGGGGTTKRLVGGLGGCPPLGTGPGGGGW